jgi:LuxR family maltose regulon positive regulatory protein
MPGLRALLYLQRALTSTLLAEHELAIRYYQRAWEHGIRSSAGHLPANAAGNLSMTYTLRGEPDRAGLWAARYADSTDADGQCTDYLAGIGFRIGAGIRALDQGDVAGVQAELDALGDGSARVELWPFIAYLNAEYGLHHGDPANALAALDHVVGSRQRALIAPAASAHLLLRARVDLLIAAELGQRARDLLPDRAASIPVLGVPLARIHLMAGEYANARRVVAGLSARSVMTPRDRLALLVIDAAAALRMGDSVAAASLFGRVLTLSEQTRIHRELATISGSDQQQLLSLAAAPADHDVIDLRPVYPDRLHLIELTEREWSLLDALVLTASRQDIADQLYLSLNTVKTQLAGLYRKLGASSREETLMRRNQLGLRR